MRGRSGLLVALAALVAAGPARAGVAAVSPFAPLQAGPALAGDHVVWADAAGDLRSALFAEGPGTRLRLPDDGLGPGERTTTLVVASPTRVAYLQDVQELGPRPGQDDFDPNHLGTVLGAGPAAGPPAIVARRRDAPADGAEALGADLDGDLLASLEVAPGDGAARLLVRDLAAGGPPAQLGAPGLAPPVRLAGAHVAAYDPTARAILVLDRATGAVELSVPAPPGDLALQADGRVAYVRDGRVLTATPAAPSPRVLATDADARAIALRGDRVAFVRRAARGVALAAVGLDGPERTLGWPTRAITGLAFDGARVAFATRSCVYAGTLPVARQASPPPGYCTAQDLRVDDARAPRLTGRRLRFGIACDQGPARGCRATLTVSARGRTLLRRPVAPRAVTTMIVQARLPAAAARTLRRARGHATVSLTGPHDLRAETVTFALAR